MSQSCCCTLGVVPSFGFGDRLGLATAGHALAMQRAGEGIAPVFVQQSPANLPASARSPAQSLTDVQAGIDRAHWQGAFGANADQLQTADEIPAFVAAGFTLYSIDTSPLFDHVAESLESTALRTRFAEHCTSIDWLDHYRGRTIELPTGNQFDLTQDVCLKAAIKLGRALDAAITLSRQIRDQCAQVAQDYEIELHVANTRQPTTLAEHYILADQSLKRGVKLVSVALHLDSAFESGVDFCGDLQRLERNLADHAAIADLLGSYKLSLHTGADKLSVYPALARTTQGRFHIRTSGTSYLEALRVVLEFDPGLFRRIVEMSRQRYPRTRTLDHVSASLQTMPPASEVSDPSQLERLYLGCWDEVPPGSGFRTLGRQVLHAGQDAILDHHELGSALRSVVTTHLDTYEDALTKHFVYHLQAVQSGMPD